MILVQRIRIDLKTFRMLAKTRLICETGNCRARFILGRVNTDELRIFVVLKFSDDMVKNIRDRHPTLPSSEIPSSFCASTANSIGSCLSTSRAKPLTISATALSALRPRLIA